MNEVDNSNLINKMAPFFILMAGCFWGLIGVFVKNMTSKGLSSFQIVMVRSVISMLTMLIYLMVFDRKKLRIKFVDIWYFIGTGVLSLTFFNACYFFAMKKLSISIACILLYTAPAFVMILAALVFREKITVQKIVSLIFVFLGCICVNGFNINEISIIGVIAGLGSGVGYSLYTIFSRLALKKYAPMTIIFYTFLTSSISTIPFSKPKAVVKIVFSDSKTLLFCIFFGFLTSSAAYILYTIGLMYVEAGKASVIATVEPLVATLTGVAIYSEKLRFANVLGILLILIGVITVNVNTKSKKISD